jgi:hypothetical protein
MDVNGHRIKTMKEFQANGGRNNKSKITLRNDRKQATLKYVKMIDATHLFKVTAPLRHPTQGGHKQMGLRSVLATGSTFFGGRAAG